MILLKAFSISIALVLLFGAVPLTRAQGSRCSLKIYNASKYSVYHLYVSSSEEEKWGPDQLGTRILWAGSTFTLTNIKVGEYDIKFVDQDLDACVLRNIKITDDTSWRVTTQWLLQCEFH